MDDLHELHKILTLLMNEKQDEPPLDELEQIELPAEIKPKKKKKKTLEQIFIIPKDNKDGKSK